MGLFHEINKIAKKWFGDTSWYVGTDGIYLGEPAEIIMQQKLGNPNINPNINIETEPKGYNYGNAGKSNTTAYKANAAGTANKIAQGGMTKDDILKYNEIHPNEIAGDNPANTTALNTNTAIRSK